MRRNKRETAQDSRRQRVSEMGRDREREGDWVPQRGALICGLGISVWCGVYANSERTKSQNEINKPVNKNRNRNNFKMQIMQMRRTDFVYSDKTEKKNRPKKIKYPKLIPYKNRDTHTHISCLSFTIFWILYAYLTHTNRRRVGVYNERGVSR